MAPTIPSPTPIVGVQSPDGKPSLRLPIDVFQKEHPFAFALYVQALAEWQSNGTEAFDKNNTDGTSYFQITGVHGVPIVPWQKDPTVAKDPNVQVGYCTHRSVLFIPWHRPYLMLYEQIIYAYAEEIANDAKGHVAEAYKDALQELRLPYWDWASNPHLPDVVMSPKITLTVPGNEAGTQATLELDHNPLYSYKFTSPYALGVIRNEMGWQATDNWADSKRCPEADGASNQEVASRQIGTFTEFKIQTFKALTGITDFDQFTCQAWRPKQGPSAYASVEGMHNNVHNFTGTNASIPEREKVKRRGNMADVQASSFDPVFWLHHVNCDRLTALWQALNPDCVINEWPSGRDRYVAEEGTSEGGGSNLEPWHKSAEHSMADYYIANDTKELTSTFANGYYYPETPLEYFMDPDQMKRHTTREIYKLYASQSLRPPALRDAKKPTGQVSRAAEMNPTSAVSNPGEDIRHWQVFLRVKNFALTGTWVVHVFLGELPDSTEDWFLCRNRVGTVTMLSNRSKEHCENCIAQEASGILVTGTVPLNEDLEKRGVDVQDEDAVVAFLTKELSWRVVKDAVNVPLTDRLVLTVGVSSQTVSIPHSPSELPQWGESHVYPEITAHKECGLDKHNREKLQV